MISPSKVQENTNMQTHENINPKSVARWVGASLLATIVIGMAGAMFISKGININLSADVTATAENMLEAKTRLEAKAYLALFMFGVEVLISLGLYMLLRATGPFLAGWCLLAGIGASMLSLMGAMFAMNAAQIAGNSAYGTLTNADGRLLLTGLQATSEYTSFHLSLVLSSVSNAGFFMLLWRSGLIPKIIAGFGAFASLFVATTIVARDFIPALGENSITMAFMLCNMIAIVSLGLYFVIKGVREV
jgi:hypothetical protein